MSVISFFNRCPLLRGFLRAVAQPLCVVLLGLSSATASESPRSLLDGMVEMRDGVRLLTDVYLPEGAGPFPVILSRVPYGTKSDYIFQPAVGEYFTRHGFAYVAQNVRGRFGSEGLFKAYTTEQEIPDAFDTVDWIIKQDWSNGNVGVMGESYFGYTTLMAAVSGHPAIKAISPANITLAREMQSLDGSFPLQASGMWTLDMDDVVKGEYQDTSNVDLYHLPLITMGSAHGLRDVLWRERVSGYSADPNELIQSAAAYYRKIRVPALHFGGWYDSFTRGSIAIWDGVRHSSEDPQARDLQWLVMGPWDHNTMSWHLSGSPPPTNIGRLELGDTAVSTYGETLVQFFNFFLKGESNGFDQRPRVSYFNIGENEWRTAENWPPAGQHEQVLYLREGGVLSPQPPEEAGVDEYQYDPKKPVTITAETDVWGRAESLPDRQTLLERADVLDYQTEPLEQSLDITGPVSLDLYASSSALNTDFTAALVDVHPDGYSLLIQEGILRASHRDKTQKPSHIVPGQVYPFTIDVWATSYTLPAGHRLRLEISSSNFPRFARNLNNGEPFGMSDRIEIATQKVFRSSEHPSRLRLPVLP